MDKTEKSILGVGIFIILAIGGTLYLTDKAPEGYDYYQCNSTGEPVVGLCWKLSNVNDDGLQTRCYWNITSTRRYKNCNTGWFNYTQPNAPGKIIELPDEIVSVKLDFLNFTNYTTTKLSCDDNTCDQVCVEIYGVRKSCKTINPFNKSIENLTSEVEEFRLDYEDRVNRRLRKDIKEIKEIKVDRRDYIFDKKMEEKEK